MKGWIIANASIYEKELRWVDAHDDLVRDGDGQMRERGTWSLMLDTAKDIAVKQAKAALAAAERTGGDYMVAYWKERLRDMRAEGKFIIVRKEDGNR